MTPFYAGQKVVCIDADTGNDKRFNGKLDGLTEGRVYTIRKVEPPPLKWLVWYPDLALPNKLWVFLEEIVRPIHAKGTFEVGYRSDRFRPLVETDISVFQALLNPTPAQARELTDA
jgi:hypothetical protein